MVAGLSWGAGRSGPLSLHKDFFSSSIRLEQAGLPHRVVVAACYALVLTTPLLTLLKLHWLKHILFKLKVGMGGACPRMCV